MKDWGDVLECEKQLLKHSAALSSPCLAHPATPCGVPAFNKLPAPDPALWPVLGHVVLPFPQFQCVLAWGGSGPLLGTL